MAGDTIKVTDTTRNALLLRHHHLNSTTGNAVVQFIAVNPDTNEVTAVSDPRKGGYPAVE